MILPILHIDAHCLVIDKPAGLAVHPGPRTPRSLEDHLWELREGFVRNPQPAHRLDRDTSGCLVLARHPKAHKKLTQLFEGGRIGKTYLAVVDGAPADDEGRIDAALAKISSAEQGWRMVVDAGGKASATRWRVLRRDGNRALVEFSPETGRTHQVRVHAAALGHPILGDPVYGAGGGPMRLHAAAIEIPYREGADPIRVTAPLPDDWPLGPE
ncbi:RluA family pseudouridine synthase [Glacieibacterium frigidum]|uniref:RluA family pseudouridine synthase n=1 Tax=Glacieibacterium frigidum TaxID=2593303 RepID=A0A552UEP8_9SPHN|nr:RluA family pseudouridine synthase [Glacieibacterium frigidum]TRW16707.1 RluA family pseudouridine synthase [Glacieibacterium frigidum]